MNDHEYKTVGTSDDEHAMNQGGEAQDDSRIATKWNKRHFSIAIMLGCFLLFVYSSIPLFNKFDGKSTKHGEVMSTKRRTAYSERDYTLVSNSHDLSPRVILMPGCSGSTALNNFIYKVLHDHGVPVHDFRTEMHVGSVYGNFESVEHYEDRVPAYVQEEVDELFKFLPMEEQTKANRIIEENWILNKDLTRLNEVLMVKSETINSKILSAFQDRFNALFTSIHRENILDIPICLIKDCFLWDPYKDMGYTVLEDGTRLELCFKRRSPEYASLKLYVYLDVNILMDFIEKLERESEERLSFSKPLMYPSKPQTSEDLYEFEHTPNEDTFQKSLNAWINVLTPLVDTLYPDIIESHMRPMQNTRSPPVLHKDEIANFDEVYSVLEKAGKLHYLRLGESSTSSGQVPV